ncbi:MAG TPA: OmpH family outer membrane protein [Nitrospiria bacterium]|jgi:outer membrane protein|nr:OmpH family outer membrane protein [Nitrospiria bacterium]
MHTIRFKRLLGFIMSIFLLSAVFAHAESLKIGTIDAQKVLENTKAGKKAKATMEEFVKSRQKIIDLEEQDIKNLEDELAKQGPVLSADAKKDKQETFQRKMLDYQKKVSELNKEVQNKKKEVLEDFNKTLEGVVKSIAEKEGYTVILDRNSEGGVILYAKESVDLTDKVVQEFNKSAQ